MHSHPSDGAVKTADRQVWSMDARPRAAGTSSRCLRLMTYNIQTGIETNDYHHYLTRSWRHFLPNVERQLNLGRIADVITEYDFVGLQEVDAGSFRSGFINQVEYLSRMAGYGHWYAQTNRNLGKLARHSNGLLSRYRPTAIQEHKLPGMIPGRGALVMHFGNLRDPLTIVLVHLALGQRTRLRQLDYLADIISDYRHVIRMGDFNCLSRSREFELLRSRTDLCEPMHDLHTFPSWRPQQNIDHILVSPTLEVLSTTVLDYPLSDHLPVTMQIALPDSLELTA
jgi:endonuclease/exonuclease/phosphatase family metal-dependent hydrolase